jgi:hypothetical protein
MTFGLYPSRFSRLLICSMVFTSLERASSNARSIVDGLSYAMQDSNLQSLLKFPLRRSAGINKFKCANSTGHRIAVKWMSSRKFM